MLNQKELIASADVVLLNNVFEFFVLGEQLQSMWQFIRNTIVNKGTLIVTIPSLKESWQRAKVMLTHLLIYCAHITFTSFYLHNNSFMYLHTQ
jgi:hypothetical protein